MEDRRFAIPTHRFIASASVFAVLCACDATPPPAAQLPAVPDPLTNPTPAVAVLDDVRVECDGPDGAWVTLDGCDSSGVAFQWADGPVAGTDCSTRGRFPIGLTSARLRVEDAAGGLDERAAAVEVVDTARPEVACDAPAEVEVDARCCAEVAVEAVASDRCDDVPALQVPAVSTVCGAGTVHTGRVAARDASGNEAVCETSTRLVDRIPPIAAFEGAEQAPMLDASCRATLPVRATGTTDNCGVAQVAWRVGAMDAATGDAASLVLGGLGVHTVEMSACDAAGGCATASADLEITQAAMACGGVDRFRLDPPTEATPGALTMRGRFGLSDCAPVELGEAPVRIFIDDAMLELQAGILTPDGDAWVAEGDAPPPPSAGAVFVTPTHRVDACDDVAPVLTVDGMEVAPPMPPVDLVSTACAARSARSLAAAFEGTGLRARVGSTRVLAAEPPAAGQLDADDALWINGVHVGAVAVVDGDADIALVSAINERAAWTGVVASYDTDGRVALYAADGRNIVVEATGAAPTITGLDSAIWAGPLVLYRETPFVLDGDTGALGVDGRVEVDASAWDGLVAHTGIAGAPERWADGALRLNGVFIDATSAMDDRDSAESPSGSAIAKAARINGAVEETGVHARPNRAVYEGAHPVGAGRLDGLFINGVEVEPVLVRPWDADGALRAAIEAELDATGVAAGLTPDGRLRLEAADGRNVSVVGGDGISGLTDGVRAGTVTLFADAPFTVSGDGARSLGVHVGEGELLVVPVVAAGPAAPAWQVRIDPARGVFDLVQRFDVLEGVDPEDGLDVRFEMGAQVHETFVEARRPGGRTWREAASTGDCP